MATLRHNLSNRQAMASQIQPSLVDLKTELDKLLPFWGKLSKAKRNTLLDNDPVLQLAKTTYLYLRDNFTEVDDVD